MSDRVKTVDVSDPAVVLDCYRKLNVTYKELKAENEQLRREAAIRIDQIEREQEAHLRTIADYNRVAVENEKLREHLAEADEANRLHLQDK